MPTALYREMLRQAAYRRARIIALREKGLSYAKIGEMLQISKQRVHQILQAEKA